MTVTSMEMGGVLSLSLPLSLCVYLCLSHPFMDLWSFLGPTGAPSSWPPCPSGMLRL